MNIRFAAAVCVGVLIGIGFSQMTVAPLVQSQETPANKPTSTESKEVEVLKASAIAFEKAYNAADAKSIATQFAENAEIVDEEGEVIKGRADIEARFAKLFEEYPKARIAVELSSLRQLGPDLAIEDGYSTTTLTPDEASSRSPYTIVHLKRGDKWLFASVRDFAEESTEATTHEQLQPLAWLVGSWVDESPDGRVETTCQWSEDGNYLLQDYIVKARRGELRGSQRIAWDPLRHTVRSWAFDHSGAFTEATWTPVEQTWILKVEGVTPDGQNASATRTVTQLNDDSYQINSANIVIGNKLVSDTSVRVVRRPPTPRVEPQQ